MKRYEYKFVVTSDHVAAGLTMEQHLTKLGGQGWRVVPMSSLDAILLEREVRVQASTSRSKREKI